MVFVKGINKILAQASMELELEMKQMAEKVEAQLLFRAKVSQQICDTVP